MGLLKGFKSIYLQNTKHFNTSLDHGLNIGISELSRYITLILHVTVHGRTLLCCIKEACLHI